MQFLYFQTLVSRSSNIQIISLFYWVKLRIFANLNSTLITYKINFMAFDIEIIKQVYAKFPARVEAARVAVGKPLTLAEKILYAHLSVGKANKAFKEEWIM